MGEVNPINLPGIDAPRIVSMRNASTLGIPQTKVYNDSTTAAAQVEIALAPKGLFDLDFSIPDNAPPLHNDRKAIHECEVEKPHHRVAAYMFAQGMNSKEIAAALDYTPNAVRDWLKIKWFQTNVTKLLHDNGGKDILELFKAEQFNSLATLLELRDSDKVSATVRANVAMNILDRAGGKPVVRVETTNTTKSDDPVAECARLEAENARLNKN